jgi:hypothetical protein
MSIDTPQHNQEKNEQKIKLSIKQKFAKLFLTSDIKNPNLRKPLSVVKSALIQNFHDG